MLVTPLAEVTPEWTLLNFKKIVYVKILLSSHVQYVCYWKRGVYRHRAWHNGTPGDGRYGLLNAPVAAAYKQMNEVCCGWSSLERRTTRLKISADTPFYLGHGCVYLLHVAHPTCHWICMLVAHIFLTQHTTAVSTQLPGNVYMYAHAKCVQGSPRT